MSVVPSRGQAFVIGGLLRGVLGTEKTIRYSLSVTCMTINAIASRAKPHPIVERLDDVSLTPPETPTEELIGGGGLSLYGAAYPPVYAG